MAKGQRAKFGGGPRPRRVEQCGMQYEIRDGLIECRVLVGPSLSRWCPDGRRALKVFAVPGSADCVVLTDWDVGPGKMRNLGRYTPRGACKWRAELPERDGADCYTDAWIADGALAAFSCSCYDCRLSWRTGRIVRQVFTK